MLAHTRVALAATWLVVGSTGAGCRRDVEGPWAGHAGGQPLELRIEQIGAKLEGDVCTPTACTPIVEGSLQERDVEILFGCEGCGHPATTLTLELDGDRLVGEAELRPCRCNQGGSDCDCRVAASFGRCDGTCSEAAP